jgi:hypothetical protein
MILIYLCIIILVLLIIYQFKESIEYYIESGGNRVNPIDEDDPNIVYIWVNGRRIPVGYMYGGRFYPKFMRRF